MANDRSTARELGEVLQPIARRLLAGRSISVGKLGVMSYLAKHGRATATTLAAEQTVSPQAIATAVRELEALGLVVRTPDGEDRRKIWIALTDGGRERLADERAAGLDWLDRALADRLTADERARLEAALPALRKLVDAGPPA
ncbi:MULTISPECIES: MarR family winged helix-turn-helix transcriptional regulator [unclassified Nocardia]|uniref:MarR family winged helix-turn-helix transcriptional regulator n=1 Tax=unclassified Nocardia TaxID=2637762 RepID=UPI0033A6A5EE